MSAAAPRRLGRRTALLGLLAAGSTLGCRDRTGRNVSREGAGSGASARVTLRAADQLGLLKGALAASGELAQVPYQLEWATFPAGPPLLEAMNANAVDVGAVGDTPPLFALSTGAQVKIVAALRNRPDVEAILVPAQSPIRNVEELRGKRVAFAKGSAAHRLVLAVLQSRGLRLSDVESVHLNPNDAQPAFVQGAVHAWAVWDPFVTNNLRQGARKLADGAGICEVLGFYMASVAALADAAKSDALSDFLCRWLRAQRWVNQNPDKWAPEYARRTQLPLETSRQMFEHYRPERIPIDAHVIQSEQRLADDFVAAGVLPRRLDVRTLLDTRFEAALSRA